MTILDHGRVVGIVRYRDPGGLDAVLDAPRRRRRLARRGHAGHAGRARGDRARGGCRGDRSAPARSCPPTTSAAPPMPGPRFVVSPSLIDEVVASALELGVEPIPGVLTPTELHARHRAGRRTRSRSSRRAPWAALRPVAALRGPFPRRRRCVPTGGIELADVAAYLEAGATAVGLGRVARRQASADERGGPRGAASAGPSRPWRRRGDRPGFDLIALGETMLSLVAADGDLMTATTFAATHGGAESNACVAMARKGLSTAWVSRLGADPAGDRIRADLGREGVDLRWVATDPVRPTGSDAPRHRGRGALLARRVRRERA